MRRVVWVLGFFVSSCGWRGGGVEVLGLYVGVR